MARWRRTFRLGRVAREELTVVNDAVEVIKRRRSIRKYKPDQVPEADLQAIVECGLLAPSAMNQQKWHFTVIRDRQVIEKMGNVMRERMLQSGNERLIARARSGMSPFHGAPALVMITADPRVRFIEIDCGAAAENLALAAEALGIGSCLMAAPGVALEGPEGDPMRRDLGIPDSYVHMISVVLGYKDCETPAPQPRKPGIVNYV